MRFEVNRGQADVRAKFISRGRGYTLFLTGDEAVFSFVNKDASVAGPGARSSSTAPPAPARASQRRSVLRMKLVDAEPGARVTGVDELPGRSNYFRGNDAKQWRSGVPAYAKVKYQGVYPGIDLVYYGNERQLEYDFVVNPGADPGAIGLSFDTGPAKAAARIAAGGDLVIPTSGGDVRFHAPVVYQPQADGRRPVESRFVLLADNRVGFAVGSYDRGQPLVIDPVLGYSTYLGGTGDDAAWGVAVDADGNAYVAGATASLDFPTTEPPNGWDTTHNGGDYDAFLSKISADGSTLVYSTYLGGSGDGYDGDDIAFGVAVDGSGNAYVTGFTRSDFFPCQNGFQIHRYVSNDEDAIGYHSEDIFLSKFSADGSQLLYSTYDGGFGDDEGYGIAADDDGNAFITGQGGAGAGSSYVLRNAFDSDYYGGEALVSRFDTTKTGDASLIYASFLGGEAFEVGIGIATDGAGHAFVTGKINDQTGAHDFPTRNAFQDTIHGAYDAFVAELDTGASGDDSLIYSSYLGGSAGERSNEGGFGIAVDGAGSAYVTGVTDTSDFPTTSGAYRTSLGGGFFSSFVTKVGADGALVYSTYFVGTGGEGIAVDGAGNAYVTGPTGSGLPTRYAPQPDYGGNNDWDAFAAKLSADGSSLVYSTYLGGSGSEFLSRGFLFNPRFGIGVDASGNATVAGRTNSTDFPTAHALYDTYGGGDWDAFVTKLEWHPDFFFSAPTAITANVGGSGTTSVVVNSFDDFSAAVSLTSPTPPAGLSPSFNPASLTPAAGGTASSTLTVALGLSVVPGSYTVNVTGTSGALTHSTTVGVTVLATVGGTSTVVSGLTAIGCIDNSGISSALLAKLNQAQAFIDAGDTQAAINTLNALLHELQAQTGKHISTSCTQDGNTFDPSAVLIAEVQALLASLGAAAHPANPILGYVVNTSRAPVAGAVVVVGGSSNNTVASVTTDVTGFYYVANTSLLVAGAKYTAKPGALPKPYRSSSPTSQSLQWAGKAVSLKDFAVK